MSSVVVWSKVYRCLSSLLDLSMWSVSDSEHSVTPHCSLVSIITLCGRYFSTPEGSHRPPKGQRSTWKPRFWDFYGKNLLTLKVWCDSLSHPSPSSWLGLPCLNSMNTICIKDEFSISCTCWSRWIFDELLGNIGHGSTAM